MAKRRGAKLTGDWNKVSQVTKNMPGDIRAALQTTLPKIGLKAESIAIKHIRDQDLGWEPLKDSTTRAKLRGEGRSEKTLIDSATYIQNITSKTNKTKLEVFAGVLSKETYKDGQEIADIAAIHEYGNDARKIPERPLWRPSFTELKAWLKTSNIIAKDIVNKLTKK